MALVLPSTARLKAKYHQTFEIKRRGIVIVRHTFLVNPQDMSQTEPALANVQQTLTGNVINDFGEGLKTVSISGVTGYKARYNADGVLRDGYTEFKHLRNEIYRKFIRAKDADYELHWYNWEDEEYYNVQPIMFKLQRNKQDALLYRYDFQFTCLNPIGRGTVPQATTTDLDFLNILQDLSASLSTISEIQQALGG